MRRRLLASFVFTLVLVLGSTGVALALDVDCWFPSDWKSKPQEAKAITDALSAGTGVKVQPRIAANYPEILTAFSSGKPSLVYVGSFVQAIIAARNLGIPLAQAVTGKEFYSGVLIYPAKEDPAAILQKFPSEIAYAVGASSGESSAKAATGGKASIGVANHGAAVGAVKAGKAKAAVVKNWWWEGKKSEYPEMAMYRIPDVSVDKNPDNVLTASNSVPEAARVKLTEAALKSKDAFGSQSMAAFDKANVTFSVELMKKGGIDPTTYSW